MDDTMIDADKFSMLDDELISNITRPSLVSFSSEDSLDQENLALDSAFISADVTKSTASPLKTSTSEHSSSRENTGTEEYEFKRPAKFSAAKRYSLTIMNDIQSAYNVNKSSSMLDVSSLMSYSPLRRDSYMYSNETLQSNSIATTKSKDSGFQRSTSCTSLTTAGSKRYDHVQSKVKQYIQTIKQTEAVRKMQKRMENKELYRAAVETSSLESAESSPLSNADTTVSKKDLMNKVKELEDELKEKECVIEQLEKNQSELRLKYAAAENRIDDLRIRASQHEEPMKSYISDEKVAELLMSSAKNSRRYSENGMTKRSKNDSREGFVRYDTTNFARPEVDSYGREVPQSSNKFFAYSPLRSEIGVSRSSSYKHVTEPLYLLSKSASNAESTPPIARLRENEVKNIPYEKNPFAKVEQWQRSLMSVNDERVMSACCAPTDDTFYMCDDSLDESQMKKSRRYQKNKDADKVRYRQSYPVGCKCDKFKKCKSKEDLSTSPPTQLAANRRKFRRTVSFASYEDSLTSSVYDDDESTSDERAEVADGVPIRHESYKRYKQRKLQEKLMKDGREFVPVWNEMKKAKSAGNIHRGGGGDVVAATVNSSTMHQNRHKRVMDCQAVGSSGCEHPCTNRKPCSKVHGKKYRKLDDCSKMATSSGCHALMRPQSVNPVHTCRPSTSYDIASGVKAVNCLPHSKSFDDRHRRGCETRDRSHRTDKLECSCLLALENLNLREHRVLAKLAAEQSCMYSRKLKKETESTLPPGMSKLCLLQK